MTDVKLKLLGKSDLGCREWSAGAWSARLVYGMAWAVVAMPPLSLVELLREVGMGTSNSLLCGT